MATPSDTVRQYALTHYVVPAKARGDRSVEVVAGDIHRALGFQQRSALVCAALGSQKFRELAGVQLSGLKGPAVGFTTTYTFTW